MKLFPLPIPGAASVACLFFQLASVASAQVPTNFDAVAKLLEVGGVFYTVVDLEGDIARFAGMGDSLIDLARKEAGGAIPPGLKASGIIRSLGLDRVKAIGMSST